MILYPRFESVEKKGTYEEQGLSGGYQLRFSQQEGERLEAWYPAEQHIVLDVLLGDKNAKLKITGNAGAERTATSCTGGVGSIREIGQALGLIGGDYVSLTLQDDGTWRVELSAPPAMFLKLGNWVTPEGKSLDAPGTIALFKEFLRNHDSAWFGLSASSGIRDSRVKEYRNAISRGIPVTFYLATGISAGGSGTIEYTADVLDLKSSPTDIPCPGEGPFLEMQSMNKNWLMITNLRPARVPLSHFVVESTGSNLEISTRSQLAFTYVRYLGTENVFSGFNANSFDNIAEKGSVFKKGDAVGERYKRFHQQFKVFSQAVVPLNQRAAVDVGIWQHSGYLRPYFWVRYREKGHEHLPGCLACCMFRDKLWVYLEFDEQRWSKSAEVLDAHNSWLDEFDANEVPESLRGKLRLWTGDDNGPQVSLKEYYTDPAKAISFIRAHVTLTKKAARVGFVFTPAEVVAQGARFVETVRSAWTVLEPIYLAVATRENQVDNQLELIGSAPTILDYYDEMANFLKQHGAIMYWWSYAIRTEYREMLRKNVPFNFYVYGRTEAGKRAITHKAKVIDFETNKAAGGIMTPDNAITLPRQQGKSAFGELKSMVARTWLKLENFEKLETPLALEDFADFGTGNEVAPQALLSGFAYARRREIQDVTDDVIDDVQEVIDRGLKKRDLVEILAAFSDSSFVHDEGDIANLYNALHALPHKHFVILHGVSGTGKSMFAQAYANGLYGLPLDLPGNPYYCMSPVQPTWQDRTPLLGYLNPLTGQYVAPEFLRFVLRAIKDPEHDYVACLDEMNLAVVEHYFADFLSAWESREGITLHAGNVENVPARVDIPSNLYIIGTVNMDETTHGFSPKVLDRAYTIEFTHVDVDGFLKSILVQDEVKPHEETLVWVFATLRELNSVLAGHGMHFAYRTMREIALYFVANEEYGKLSKERALDLMLCQKVLPKLRGDDRMLPMLKELRRIVQETITDDSSKTVLTLDRLIGDAQTYGTFQFWR